MIHLNTQVQQHLLESILSDYQIFALSIDTIKSEYFDPEFTYAIEFVQEYFNTYGNCPPVDIVAKESSLDLKRVNITPDTRSYTLDRLNEFCRKRALLNAIAECTKSLSTGKDIDFESEIKKAQMVGISKDVTCEYFADIKDRYERAKTKVQYYPTCWAAVNEDIIGLAKKQLTIFLAPPGGGKSIGMANLAGHYAAAGLNVLVVSLELDTDMIGNRFDSIFSGIEQRQRESRQDEVIAKVLAYSDGGAGKIFIEALPSGTRAMDVQVVLERLQLKEGIKIDVVIYDYLDLMAPNTHIALDATFHRDKYITEQVRDLAKRYDHIAIGASQLNRSAIEVEEVNQSHTAGGISKINTCDNAIALVMPTSYRNIGKMVFQYLKTRSSDAVGKKRTMVWEPQTLRITDSPEETKASPMLLRKLFGSKINITEQIHYVDDIESHAQQSVEITDETVENLFDMLNEGVEV